MSKPNGLKKLGRAVVYAVGLGGVGGLVSWGLGALGGG